MSGLGRNLIIAGVLLFLAAVLTDKCYSSRASEWERRVRVAMSEADQLRSRAEAAEQEAEELRSQAVAAAEAAEARDPIIRHQIDTVRVMYPAETPGEIARDTIIDDLVEQRDQYHLAYDLERQAHEKTREALFAEQVRGDSLYILLEERPKEPPWYIPSLGVGPFAGLCSKPHTEACMGPVAVTLTWKLKF